MNARTIALRLHQAGKPMLARLLVDTASSGVPTSKTTAKADPRVSAAKKLLKSFDRIDKDLAVLRKLIEGESRYKRPLASFITSYDKTLNSFAAIAKQLEKDTGFDVY